MGWAQPSADLQLFLFSLPSTQIVYAHCAWCCCAWPAAGCVTHDFSALTLEAGSKLGADTFTPVVRWQTTYEMLQVGVQGQGDAAGRPVCCSSLRLRQGSPWGPALFLSHARPLGSMYSALLA